MKDTDRSCSRRNFLSQSSFALTAGAAGISFRRTPEKTAYREAFDAAGKEIIHRTLGRTGLKVPIVNMGVMNADNPEVVKQSYEAGVRLFDTAMGYQGGRNEEMVGGVIRRLGVRDEVIIQTKVPFPRGRNLDDGAIRQQFLDDFDGCLRRLRTDYVDILMIHQPSVSQMNNPGVMEALKEAKAGRKARFVGVSTHAEQADILNEAARSEFYDVVLASFNFTNADQALIEAVRNAAGKGIGVIAMKTQATGRRFRNAGTVNQTAALKWVLHHQEITTAVPGYTNFDHMKEDFSVAYGIDYTEEEKGFLSDKNLAVAMQFCRQCRACLPTCPRGADVPTLMRAHMYAACYTNFHQARAALAEIPDHAGLGNCSRCAACVAGCVNGITVAANIDDLKLMYC